MHFWYLLWSMGYSVTCFISTDLWIFLSLSCGQFLVHTTVVRKDVWYDFNPLNLLRLVCGLTFDPIRRAHVHLRRMWTLLLRDGICCKYLESTCSNQMRFILHAYLESALKFVHQLGNVQRQDTVFENTDTSVSSLWETKTRERGREREATKRNSAQAPAGGSVDRTTHGRDYVRIRGDDQTMADTIYCEVSEQAEKYHSAFPGENKDLSLFG